MKFTCFSDVLPSPVPLNKFVSIFTSRPINAESILKPERGQRGKAEEKRWFYTFSPYRHPALSHLHCTQGIQITVERRRCQLKWISCKTNLFWSKSVCLPNSLIISHLYWRWELYDSLKKWTHPKHPHFQIYWASKGLQSFLPRSRMPMREGNRELLSWTVLLFSVGSAWRHRTTQAFGIR